MSIPLKNPFLLDGSIQPIIHFDRGQSNPADVEMWPGEHVVAPAQAGYLLSRSPPPGLRAAWPALRDREVAVGLWLTMVPGLAFGVLDVLTPLRLGRLGASATVIGGTLLGAAAIESVLSPLAGRLSDRRGALTPIRISLTAAVVVSLLAPLLAPLPRCWSLCW